jgi:hypothetical protein
MLEIQRAFLGKCRSWPATTCTIVVLSSYIAVNTSFRWIDPMIQRIVCNGEEDWLVRILAYYHPVFVGMLIFFLAPWLVSALLPERRRMRAAATSAGLVVFGFTMFLCEEGIPIFEVPAGVLNALILISIVAALYGCMIGGIVEKIRRRRGLPSSAQAPLPSGSP